MAHPTVQSTVAISASHNLHIARSAPDARTHIEWSYSGKLYRARIEASALPYVAALGADRAANLFLKLGGGEAYFSKKPYSESEGMVVSAIGREGSHALNTELGPIQHRVPLANHFLIRHLRSKRKSVAAIARIVRCAEPTVRKVLRTGKVVEQFELDSPASGKEAQ